MTDTTTNDAGGASMHKYELSIFHDPTMTERPDEYAVTRLVSFNPRHVNYMDPDNFQTMPCGACEGSGFIGDHWSNTCPTCEGAGEVETDIVSHPDVVGTLSYYEHGLGLWSVNGPVVPDPGGWDTVSFAGVVVFNGDEDERAWWNSLADDARRRAMDAVAEEFTNWWNGETYGYFISERHVCPTCEQNVDNGALETLSGIIGSAVLAEYIADSLVQLGIGIDDVSPEFRGDYGFILDIDDISKWLEE